MRSLRTLPILLLALLVLAAGCGGDDPAPSATDAATDTATDAATEHTQAEPAETEAAPPAAETETSEQTAEGSSDISGEVAVVLEPGALGFADDTGSITRLNFGEADKETTNSAVATAFGEPTQQEDGLECGPGTLDFVRWDGLTVYYQDGALAGWYLDQAPPQLTTAEGIGLGTKLGEVREAYGDVSVQETSIGFEFTAGDQLSGLLTADSDDDTVTTLWSGANCIAR